jgi:biopolymer transport protein ExbB/biopolymer transport protein TolQ
VLITNLLKLALLGASWVLYLLMALSVFSIAIMVERWWFFRKNSGDIDKLGDQLVARLRASDRRGAEQALVESRAFEARILRPALDFIDGGPEAVEEALESSIARHKKELERGMTFLGTLGNNAPFVGLFGTVIGVIEAFNQLGSAGQNQDAMGNVMVGISEALIATGVGLLVALPAVVAFNLAQKKVGEVETNVTALSKQVLAVLKSDERLAREFKMLSDAPPAVRGKDSQDDADDSDDAVTAA